MADDGHVEVRDIETEKQDLLISHFRGQPAGFARFGRAGYLMPQSFRAHAQALRAMTTRPDDAWVVTFPRSGTTWTQEMVWLIKNDLDYETALQIPLQNRYLFLEYFSIISGIEIEIGDPDKDFIDKLKVPAYKISEDVPSPRFIKTHLALSLLPPRLLDTCKVVYVARDPRDVVVSYYHFTQLIKHLHFVEDFKSFWKLFMAGLVTWAPSFPHLKEAWAQRKHPNMLFLFYEDMKKDMPSTLRRVSAFFGKEYSAEQLAALCEHLDIKNFKNNESTNPAWMKADSPLTFGGREEFVRKGEVGGWRNYMDAEMQAEAARWIQDNLADTDLRFPS
ncbi:sulfotransferase 1B1-like isoform X1 [Choristoneura fumiferana]|uniref:sulfotransferase 1B1-like isoform X1 n=1 Tax=Choristoneura fumiferana TaxID=7141 RepID=UPI003D15C024